MPLQRQIRQDSVRKAGLGRKRRREAAAFGRSRYSTSICQSKPGPSEGRV